MEEAIVLTYDISANGFTRTGEASSSVKRKLKQMGVSPDAIRKVAIAIYEGEINMIIRVKGGVIAMEITTKKTRIVLTDMGPGIPSVKLTMQTGYSTTPGEIRSLGFGTGIGLPSIKKYSDSMGIDTRIGEGTTITMMVNLQNARMKE